MTSRESPVGRYTESNRPKMEHYKSVLYRQVLLFYPWFYPICFVRNVRIVCH